MCGIVGVLRYGALGDNEDRTSALYLATTLLELTESRGKDATGIAALFDNGNFFGQKMPLRATDFVTRFGGADSDFDSLQAILREYKESSLRTIIGHCRKKSVGGVFDNVNNHPIKVNNIIGLHNGTLKNHDVIFENLKCGRDGTVDSEAIFRLLDYYTKSCKNPFTLEMLEEVTKRLEGSFSVLAFNANNPSQLVSARDGRPAEYCLIRPLKMILIASEEKILKAAIWNYNKLAWNHNFPGFKKLKASDIETKTLTDDTIALFDMTREVTPETKITDLYDTHPVPKLMNRIWKTPIKTYNNGYNRNQTTNYKGNKTAADDADEKEKKKSESSDSTNKDHSTAEDIKKAKKAVGLAWSTKLEKYVTAWGNRDNEGNIVLDMEKKELMSLSEALKENKLDFEDTKLESNVTIVDFKGAATHKPNTVDDDDDDDGLEKKLTSVEDFHTDKAVSITNITPVVDKVSTKPTAIVKKDTVLAALRAGAARGKSEVSDDLDASKATIAEAKKLEKFDTAAEVASMCNMDEMSLEQLSPVALANRIMRYHFAKFFTAGYLNKCADVAKDKQQNRVSKAQKHIRILKGITSLMGGFMPEGVKDKESIRWIEMLNKKGTLGEISAGSIQEIFNAGDLRGNKVLRNIVSTLDNAK